MSKQQDLRPSFKYIKIKCIGIHLHACTHSKNTSSHTCCTGFVFVYSIYDGCTLMCPKTKQEDNLCIHTTIIDYTKAILFRNYWSYNYHFLSMKRKKKKNLAGRNSLSYQVSTQSENLLYSTHIWYEYFCLEQGSNTCAILKYFFT